MARCPIHYKDPSIFAIPADSGCAQCRKVDIWRAGGPPIRSHDMAQQLVEAVDSIQDPPTSKLRGLIKDRPALWDSEQGINKINRQIAMEEVAAQMGITIQEGFAKWTRLRGQYIREEKRVLGNGTDSEADTNYKTKWFAYDIMKSFMRDYAAQKTEKNKPVLQTSETPHEKPRLLPWPVMQPIAQPIVLTPVRVTSQPDNKHSTNVYPLQTLQIIRDKRKEPPEAEVDDDVTSFTKYMAAQLRKLEPHMQSKAKFDISSLLYKYEMESMDS